MQFLGDLGVDVWLLLAQIGNFAFLLWLLSKFVYKPLIHRIEKDEATLEAVAKAQADLKEKEKQLERKEKQYTTRTKNRAKTIITEAEEMAEMIRQTARDEAIAEKEAVIEQINKRLEEVLPHDEK